MKLSKWLTVSFLLCIFSPAQAQDISAYKMEKRPVIIFTSKESHSKYLEQMRYLNAAKAELEERDVVVMVDSKPTPASSLRLQFMPQEFLFVLVGKDGGVKHRSSEPVSIEELTAIIDAMPMRQREMSDKS